MPQLAPWLHFGWTAYAACVRHQVRCSKVASALLHTPPIDTVAIISHDRDSPVLGRSKPQPDIHGHSFAAQSSFWTSENLGMDPLSITAGVVGFIGATVQIIQYLESVRHQKEDARTFAEGFRQIKSDLESLLKLLRRIEQQHALPSATPTPLDAHRQHEDQYSRAREMCAPGGDCDKIKVKLDALCSKVTPNAKSRRENLKAGLTWVLRKERIKEEQNEVVAHLRRMRDMLSDDHVGEQLETTKILRELKYDKDVNNNIEILDWICAGSLDSPLHPASGLVLENASFVRSDSVYTQWHEDKLWQLNCYGKPGAGKSIRAQAVLSDLHQRYDRHATPVLSIFFNYKNSARQSLTLVLCSLLRQLITTEKPVKIPQSVLGAWQNSQFSGKRPLDEHLARDLLLQELSRTEYKFLVIDALDEAEGCLDTINTEIHRLRNHGVCIFSTEMHEHRIESDNAFCYRHQIGPGPWDRLIMYWQCKKCHGPFGRGVEICQDCFVNKRLTCEDPSHVLNIPGRIHFEVRASPQDMERFAKQFLEDASSGGDVGDDDYMYAGNAPLLAIVKADIGADTWDTIPTKIAEAADGNFLHANLFLERLKEQRHTDGALSLLKRLQLGSLPDIEDQYHEKLARCLQGSGAQVARDHLSIVAAAMDVLHFNQLSHAAAITLGSRSLSDFIGRCCRQEVVWRDTAGLLTIDPGWQSDTFLVGFSHRTLSVYIKSYPEKTLPDAGQRMFDACLSYLSLDKFAKPFTTSSQLDDALKEYAFASYAACYWAMHTRDVNPTARNTLRVLELLGNPQRLDCAMQIAWHVPSVTASTWDVSGGITPIHACAFYGLHTICALLIDANSSIDPVEEQYKQTPLIYACRQGHLKIVQLLLKAGANPNHLTKLGKSPLLEAIEFDHEDIFQLLIAEDTIDINLRGTGKNDRTPLVKAAELGRDGMAWTLLGRAEIRVNNVDGWNCTALSRAVQNLQVDCVRQLLSHADTDLSLRDDAGDRTALDWLVEDFLDYDHNSDIIHDIAAMLVADSRTPLPSDDAIVSAIVSGKLELLRIYVQGSLHHLYTDTYGRNFLHLAATEGICAIVTLFHTQFAKEPFFNIDTLDQYKATALHAVCGRLSDTSHVETIKFLLDAGANPTLKDDQGYTPGMRARRASQDLWDSHVKTLFTSTNMSDPIDLNGNTPITLRVALNSAKVDAFKATLDQLPDPLLPEIAHYSNSTILHHAMELPDDFRQEVLSLLLPRSEKFLSDTDADGQTCAHLAIKQNSLETLKLLCQAGIDINHRDRWGLTPFELAQRWQRLDLCVYLVSQGASLPTGEDIRPDVLRAAVESGDLTSVKRLVHSGVDANFRDLFKGQTHLQRAEELKEQAARISNDELLAKNDANIMKDKATWDKHRDSAPEVFRRDNIVQFLRNLQDNTATADAKQAEPDRALTALMEELEALDPDTILPVSRIEDDQERTDPPSLSMGPNGVLMNPSLSNSAVALPTFDVGYGVVMIAIAIVLGFVTVAITWINSSVS